ncbi:MAG: hypothetical protein KBD21_04925 [Candidatus Pacebacteria bacterium]|nr:hypothetical protein [Candidatus Paceibacterota bacterium]
MNENINTTQEIYATTGAEKYVNETKLREAFFLSYVNRQLLDVFEDALWELPDMTDAEFQRWQGALALLDEEHLNAFLSTPHELVEQRIEALRKKMLQGEIMSIVQEEAQRVYERGYRVAYHCSPTEHNPVKSRGDSVSWTIDGREPDHRDDDVGMAYYSMDLGHLYRKKNPNYIYLVRADVGGDSGHRRDNDGAWGRAPKLDVITRIDFKEALCAVEDAVTEFRKQNTAIQKK